MAKSYKKNSKGRLVIDEDYINEAIKGIQEQLMKAGVLDPKGSKAERALAQLEGDLSSSNQIITGQENEASRLIVEDVKNKLSQLKKLSADLKTRDTETSEQETETFLGVEGAVSEFLTKSPNFNIGKLIAKGDTTSTYVPADAARETVKKVTEYNNNAEKALVSLRKNLGSPISGSTVTTWNGKPKGIQLIIDDLEKEFKVDLSEINIKNHIEGTDWDEIADELNSQIEFTSTIFANASKFIEEENKIQSTLTDLADKTENLLFESTRGNIGGIVQYLEEDSIESLTNLDSDRNSINKLLSDEADRWLASSQKGLVSSREVGAGEEVVPAIGEPKIEDVEVDTLPQPDVSVEEEAFLNAEILEETPLTQAEIDADRLANTDAFAAADASMLPELSEVGGDPSTIPAVGGASTGGPSGGPSTPEGFNAELDAIGDTFDVASQFGYRFFFFKPGTDEPREDMMISNPVILDRLGLDAPINVLQYIKEEGLTNPREIEAAFAETEWYANTNETMQQFDLDWDAAAPSGALNDDFTLRRKEIVKTELDYISGQLEALGLSDEMTEAQQLALAKTAKRTGMSLQDIRQTLSSVELDFATFTGADGAGTGLLGSYETSIKNMASQYMIGIDEKSLDDYVLGVYQSDDPEQNMLMLKEQLAETAKERFPTLGGLIDRGMTPAQYFAPYSSKASALLERQVDFMGSDESLFNQIASGMPDNETGSRTMTFTEANELIRGTAEWQTTKNANDEARTIADDVGRMFGFVA